MYEIGYKSFIALALRWETLSVTYSVTLLGQSRQNYENSLQSRLGDFLNNAKQRALFPGRTLVLPHLIRSVHSVI